MIEPIGPAIARSIVGENYSSEFRYELETDDEGLHLIVTNKTTGESYTRHLTDTEKPPEEKESLFPEEREQEIQSAIAVDRLHSKIGIVVTFTVIAISVIIMLWAGGKF